MNTAATLNLRLRRCSWAGDYPPMVRYHDEEWGVPVHDDRLLFEFLILEGAQAGLTWRTIAAHSAVLMPGR
jgi:DNA-3-methyladenine glycosylase I